MYASVHRPRSGPPGFSGAVETSWFTVLPGEAADVTGDCIKVAFEW
jgi:hypothetical protein